MKMETVCRQFAPCTALLQCPLCGSALRLQAYSLMCTEGHCFDLSKRGYANLAPQQSQRSGHYDAALFQNRQVVFADGFYAPLLSALRERVLTALASVHANAPCVLDAGCGEGYYAHALQAALGTTAQVIGMDLSREAVVLACGRQGDARFVVADLSRIPLRDASAHAVLNLLSPANYAQFARVLHPCGQLIKVVPGPQYLQELRTAAVPQLRHAAQDATPVVDRLQERFSLLSDTRVTCTSSVTPAQAQRFWRMTPMTAHLDERHVDFCALRTITVDLRILCAVPRQDI